MFAMKQMEVTEYTIGDYTFYVKPFPAFVAANISAELAKVIAPILGAIAPLFGGLNEDVGLSDVKAEDAGNALGSAFSNLSAEEFDSLLKKLLITNKNVSVCGPLTEGATKQLDMEMANEIFCGDVQNMFVLCFYVISLNYKGFFKKLGSRFGNLTQLMAEKTAVSSDMESLT